MQSLCPFRVGDTFSLLVTYYDGLGEPIDLVAQSIVPSSQVRTGAGALIATLDVTVLNQTTNKGQYTLSCADTTTWPENAQLYADIKYVTGGTVTTHTDRFGVLTAEGITQ